MTTRFCGDRAAWVGQDSPGDRQPLFSRKSGSFQATITRVAGAGTDTAAGPDRGSGRPAATAAGPPGDGVAPGRRTVGRAVRRQRRIGPGTCSQGTGKGSGLAGSGRSSTRRLDRPRQQWKRRMALPSSHPRHRRTSMAESSPHRSAARRPAAPASRQLASTAPGARSVLQETTFGPRGDWPSGVALLSSGTVHIPDGWEKSKDYRKKLLVDRAAREISPNYPSGCDLRKKSRPALGAGRQGLADAQRRRRRAGLRVGYRPQIP